MSTAIGESIYICSILYFSTFCISWRYVNIKLQFLQVVQFAPKTVTFAILNATYIFLPFRGHRYLWDSGRNIRPFFLKKDRHAHMLCASSLRIHYPQALLLIVVRNIWFRHQFLSYLIMFTFNHLVYKFTS